MAAHSMPRRASAGQSGAYIGESRRSPASSNESPLLAIPTLEAEPYAAAGW